jgi:uncharacterized protein (TIGR02996 family)
MNDLDALHAALDKDPADATTRLALGDWYEEQGDHVAAMAWRWLYRAGRYPRQAPHNTWQWWRIGFNPAGPDDLPADFFAFVETRNDGFREYDTRRQAEEALVESFRKAIAAGWVPPALSREVGP